MVFNFKSKSLLVSGLVIFLSLLVLLITFVFKQTDIVYVDNIKLFEGFNMTKEMKKKGEVQFQNQKNRLDSLYKTIAALPLDKQESFSKQFVLERNALEQSTQQYAIQESEKIWKRLNEYIKEYSSNNGYKLVLGSTNQQQVLYADSDVDITNDLIIFVNKRYEGD